MTERLRVALYNLTTTTTVGGVESFVWDLSRELAAHGHDVTIIGGRGAIREDAPGIRVVTLPFIERGWFRRIPPLRRAYAETKLLERLTLALTALPLLALGRFDIIHIQKPYDLAPALLARALSGARVVLGCHGEDFYRGDTLLADHVDAAVSCSQFNARTVAARYGFTPEVVFNGIDTHLFRPVAPDAGLRARLQIPDDAPLLLYVGRLQPWKGVDTALHALKHLPTAHLIIAGDGVERERLTALAQTLDVAGRAHFVGMVDRATLPQMFASADLLVATSFASETFGIGLVEAQACGLPVVASDWGGFPEVVDAGRTGLLYPPRNAEALAAAVRTLLGSAPLRAAMAAAAPAWAAQFAWPAVTARIEQVYAGVRDRGSG